ncbi:MAG: hypothetical protein HY435_02595 [Candidatus Liptonbacteria bacterium]|nr:hypothetical protein [Candidatus Liptonbacteria bacterium]
MAHILNVNLLKELGLDSLPKERQQKVLDEMMEVVEKRLTARILSLLSDEEQKQFDAVLVSGGDVASFLRTRIANFDAITADVVANFKQEMFDLNRAAEQKLGTQ